MYKNLEVFRISHAMATHAGARQAMIARNMANSDTPGYAARDLAPFQATLDENGPHFGLKATRASHLNHANVTRGYEAITRDGVISDPNGNSVSVETEMMHAVNVKRQHDRAVAIYKSALNVLRSAVSR